MKDLISRLVARFQEEGQALAEYTLILAFIFFVCVVALGFLGGAILASIEALIAGFPSP